MVPVAGGEEQHRGALAVELESFSGCGGARGEPPGPATQRKIKQKDCFLGLCGLFFVLVSRF